MGRVFTRMFFSVLMIVCVISMLRGSSTVTFAASAIVLFVFGLRYWSEHFNDKMVIKRSLSKTKTFPGQKIFYEVEIENRKLLPVIYMKLRDSVTPGIDFTNKRFVYNMWGSGNDLTDVFSLKWYERLKKSYEFKASERGIFSFGKGKLLYYDFLGIFSNHIMQEDEVELIVYPRIVPVTFCETGCSRLFGSKIKEGWIFQDELNKMGLKLYCPTDRFKQINWKVTARQQVLVSNLYKPSYDTEVHLFLSGSGSNSEESRNSMETAVICAASLLDLFGRKGYQMGLYTNYVNKKYDGLNGFTINRPSRNPAHFEALMTSLAMLKTGKAGRMPKLMEMERDNIKAGAAVIFITGDIDGDECMMLQYYNRYYKLTVININGERKQLPGIRQYYFDSKVKWDEIETITLYS